MSETSSESFEDSVSFMDEDQVSPPTFQPQRFLQKPVTKKNENRSFSADTKNAYPFNQFKPNTNSWVAHNQKNNMPLDLRNSINSGSINIGGNFNGLANAKNRSPSQSFSDRPTRGRKSRSASKSSKSPEPERKRPKRVFRLDPVNKYEKIIKKVKTDPHKTAFTLPNKKKTQIDQIYQFEYGDERYPQIQAINEDDSSIFNLIEPKNQKWFLICYHISKISLRLIELISGTCREEIKTQGNQQVRISLRQRIIEEIKKYPYDYERQMEGCQMDRYYKKAAQHHMLNIFLGKIWMEDWLTDGSPVLIVQRKKMKSLNPNIHQIELYPYAKQPFDCITLNRVIFCPTYLTSGKFFSAIIALRSSILKVNPNTASSNDVLLYKILSDNLYALKNEAKLTENAHFMTQEIVSWLKSTQFPPKMVILDLNSTNLRLTRLRISNQCYEITQSKSIDQKIVQKDQEISKNINESLHQKFDAKGINVVVYIKRFDKAFKDYSFPFNLDLEISKKVSTSAERHKQNLSLVRTVAHQFKHILYQSNNLNAEQLENLGLLNVSWLQLPTTQIGNYYNSKQDQYYQYLDGIQLLIDLLSVKNIDQQLCGSQSASNFKLQKIKQKFLSLPFQNGYFLSHSSLRKHFNSNPYLKSCIMVLDDIRNSATNYFKQKIPISGYQQDIFLLGSTLEKYVAIHDDEKTGIIFKKDKFSQEFVNLCVKKELISDQSNNHFTLKVHPKLILEAIKPSTDQIIMQKVRSTKLITNLIDNPTIIGCLFERILIQMLLLGSTRLILPQITSRDFKNISSVAFPFISFPINYCMSSYQNFNFLSSFYDSWVNNNNLLKLQPCIFLPVQKDKYHQIYFSKQQLLKTNKFLSKKNSKSIDFAITYYNQPSKTFQIWLCQSTIQSASKITGKIARFIYNFIELIHFNKENEVTMKHWKDKNVETIKINYIVITTQNNSGNQRIIQINSQNIMKKVYQIIQQKQAGYIDAKTQYLKELNFATDETGFWMKADQNINSNSKVTLSLIGLTFLENMQVINNLYFLQEKFYKKIIEDLLYSKQKLNSDQLTLQDQKRGPNTDFELTKDISAQISQHHLKTQYQRNSHNQSKPSKQTSQNKTKLHQKLLRPQIKIKQQVNEWEEMEKVNKRQDIQKYKE